MKKATILFEDEELYKAVKMRAVQEGRTLKAVVAEVLEVWLSTKEDEEDARYVKQARREVAEGRTVP